MTELNINTPIKKGTPDWDGLVNENFLAIAQSLRRLQHTIDELTGSEDDETTSIGEKLKSLMEEVQELGEIIENTKIDLESKISEYAVEASEKLLTHNEDELAHKELITQKIQSAIDLFKEENNGERDEKLEVLATSLKNIVETHTQDKDAHGAIINPITGRLKDLEEKPDKTLNMDFDSLAGKVGCVYLSSIQGDNTVHETIKTIEADTLLAKRVSQLVIDGSVEVSTEFYPYSVEIDGHIIETAAYKITESISRNSDGSIERMVV